MNFNRLLLPLGILCGLLTSCLYPYPPNPRTPLEGQSPDPVAAPPKKKTVSSNGQKKIRKKRSDVAKKKSSGSSSSSPPSRKPDTPAAPPKKDYRTGVPIPGKEGFVFNPFTNNPVDVRAIPPGTLVRDPADPNPDHKFRVP